MAHPMSDEERRAFLSEGTRTAKLATVRADGRPHLAPVWFVLDGDDIVFMTGSTTVKGRNIARDPRIAVTVDLEEMPYSFVLVEGTAVTSDDVETTLPWSRRIADRYVAAEMAEEFARRNAVPGELLVRLTPSKITAVADLTD